jgi:hypothetical protein
MVCEHRIRIAANQQRRVSQFLQRLSPQPPVVRFDGPRIKRSVSRLVAALAVIGCAGVPTASAQSDCSSTAPDFVQITSMKLDAGDQTFEAFRIRPDGMTEWARWNSSGVLLNLGALRDAKRKDYQKVLSFASVSSARHWLQGGGAPGRPAFRLEIAAVSRSGIRARSMTSMPQNLATLVDELRKRVAVTALRSGSYVWTKPYINTGDIDIDLTTGKCDAGIAAALSGAVVSGSLVVRASDTVRRFVSGERANRMEFVVRIALGEMRFGVVSAR